MKRPPINKNDSVPEGKSALEKTHPVCLFIGVSSVLPQGRAAELQIVKYAQNGNRLAYEVELLQRALDLTQEEYSPAKLQHHEFKPSVVLFEQALAKGVFDVAFLPSSTKRENRIQAVKIPLTLGLMSYRLLVV